MMLTILPTSLCQLRPLEKKKQKNPKNKGIPKNQGIRKTDLANGKFKEQILLVVRRCLQNRAGLVKLQKIGHIRQGEHQIDDADTPSQLTMYQSQQLEKK